MNAFSSLGGELIRRTMREGVLVHTSLVVVGVEEYRDVVGFEV
jgi:hypothetical protein